jgi:hypothetical protein
LGVLDSVHERRVDVPVAIITVRVRAMHRNCNVDTAMWVPALYYTVLRLPYYA